MAGPTAQSHLQLNSHALAHKLKTICDPSQDDWHTLTRLASDLISNASMAHSHARTHNWRGYGQPNQESRRDCSRAEPRFIWQVWCLVWHKLTKSPSTIPFYMENCGGARELRIRLHGVRVRVHTCAHGLPVCVYVYKTAYNRA